MPTPRFRGLSRMQPPVARVLAAPTTDDLRVTVELSLALRAPRQRPTRRGVLSPTLGVEPLTVRLIPTPSCLPLTLPAPRAQPPVPPRIQLAPHRLHSKRLSRQPTMAVRTSLVLRNSARHPRTTPRLGRKPLFFAGDWRGVRRFRTRKSGVVVHVLSHASAAPRVVLEADGAELRVRDVVNFGGGFGAACPVAEGVRASVSVAREDCCSDLAPLSSAAVAPASVVVVGGDDGHAGGAELLHAESSASRTAMAAKRSRSGR
jgi:hypothetical protein